MKKLFLASAFFASLNFSESVHAQCPSGYPILCDDGGCCPSNYTCYYDRGCCLNEAVGQKGITFIPRKNKVHTPKPTPSKRAP